MSSDDETRDFMLSVEDGLEYWPSSSGHSESPLPLRFRSRCRRFWNQTCTYHVQGGIKAAGDLGGSQEPKTLHICDRGLKGTHELAIRRTWRGVTFNCTPSRLRVSDDGNISAANTASSMASAELSICQRQGVNSM